MAPASNLAAFLVLSAAATPACDAFAFAPSSPRLQQPIVSISRLSASNQDETEVVVVVDGWRKMTGGAAAFLTGMGIMAQVAVADPSGVASIDTGELLLLRLGESVALMADGSDGFPFSSIALALTHTYIPFNARIRPRGDVHSHCPADSDILDCPIGCSQLRRRGII